MRLLGAEVRPATSRQPHAEGRHQRGPARLGGRPSRTRTTAWARRWARTRTRGWCASCTGSSATRPASSAGRSLGGDPDVVVACVGGGSNAIGIFSGFADCPGSSWSGSSRPAGRPSATASPASSTARSRSCCRTRRARCSRPSRCRPASTTPASAPSTPTWPRWAGPATRPSTDPEVLDAFELLARTEGIIPALESAHALAWISRERESLARQGRARQPVGPRRQGRGAGRPAAGRRPVRDGGRMTSPAPSVAPATAGPLEARLRDLRDGGRKLLVPYVTGGLPGLGAGGRGLRRRRRRRHRGRHPVLRPGDGRPHHPGGVRAGAGRRAPPRRAIIGSLRDLDTGGVPLVVMTYYNIVHRYGHERFARSLAEAGVSGAIVPDLPLEEVGPVGRRRRRRRGRDDPARRPDGLRRPARPHLRPVAGLRLRRRAARRHRRAGVAGPQRPRHRPPAQGRDRHAGARRRRGVERRPRPPRWPRWPTA